MSARVRVGTSGWSYDHWDGAFYPEGVKPADRLRYYACAFPTVEVNATFYRLPAEKTVRAWRDAVGDDFAFAVKGSRFITHYRKLSGAEEAVATFCERVSVLGAKLHVVLWQLPPDLKLDATLLEAFVSALPGGIRHAIEFRHPSWLAEEAFDALRAHGVAHVHVSSDAMPVDLTTTADFVYTRFHGLSGYHGAYVRRELEPWAEFLSSQRAQGRDGYSYFNNDANACAPRDAVVLAQLSEALREPGDPGEPREPQEPGESGEERAG